MIVSIISTWILEANNPIRHGEGGGVGREYFVLFGLDIASWDSIKTNKICFILNTKLMISYIQPDDMYMYYICIVCYQVFVRLE